MYKLPYIRVYVFFGELKNYSGETLIWSSTFYNVEASVSILTFYTFIMDKLQ